MEKEQLLNKWLETACKEITQLKVNDHIFWEVQDIIKQSKNLKGRGGSFFQWMGHSYISDVTVRLRRVTDTRSNSRSFLKFLERLKTEPTLLTRERYVSLYGIKLQEIAHKDFDTISGKGSTSYSVAAIEKDIKLLKETVERINEYTNHYITHLASEDVLGKDYKPPTFDEVRSAIDGICKMALRYKLLCLAVGQTDILPTWTYNWKSVFEVPWISTVEGNS